MVIIFMHETKEKKENEKNYNYIFKHCISDFT